MSKKKNREYEQYIEPEEVMDETAEALKRHQVYSLKHMKYSIDFMPDSIYGLLDTHLEENKEKLYNFLATELYAEYFECTEWQEGIETGFFTFDKDERFMVDIDKEKAIITCSIIRRPYSCSRYRFSFDCDLKDVLKAYIAYYLPIKDTRETIGKIERFVKENRSLAEKRQLEKELKVNKVGSRKIFKV